MARFVSAAVLTAVLAPAIGQVLALAQLTAGCTSSSFTTPSWLVQDFESQTAANLTVASFHALNRATNVSVELRCSSSDPTAGWQSCKSRNQTEQPLTAAFQADTSTAWFLFNETWSCSDVTPSKPITFSAVGNSSVPLTCTTNQGKTTTTCRATRPLLVKAALSSPVKITPSYVSGPLGHDTEGCTAQSKTPTWEVAATQLNLRKVAGTLQSGNAFVIIGNDHLGYTASCGGILSAAGGPQPLACQGQISYRRPDKYNIETTLSFEPETFTLAINQTWYCDDQGPAQPISITASGTTPLSLECQVFNETAASETTTFCSGGTNGTFAGNTTARALLPPYSLDDPLPTAESCTVASVVSPAWWFNDFETNTTTAAAAAAAGGGNGTVTARFGLELQTGPASTGNFAVVAADGVRVAAGTHAPGDPQWNACVLESVGDATLAPAGCEFRYDMASRFLGVRVRWSCADLDAGSPIAFSGEVRTLVPELTCVTSGTNIRCASPDPAPWRANVTDVAWK